MTEVAEYLAAVWLPFEIGGISCLRRLRVGGSVGAVSPTATPVSLWFDFVAIASVDVATC